MQVNPQTGQPDYSVQWVEYYRSLGMHREADLIEQQAKANKVPLDVWYKINVLAIQLVFPKHYFFSVCTFILMTKRRCSIKTNERVF